MKNSSKILLILLLIGGVLALAGFIACFFDLILGVVFIALGLAAFAASKIVSYKAQAKLQAADNAKKEAERKRKELAAKIQPPEQVTSYDDELYLAYCYKNLRVEGIKRNSIKLGEWLDVTPAPSYAENKKAVAIEFNGVAIGYLTDQTVGEITYRLDKDKKNKSGVLAVAENEPLSTVTVAFYRPKDLITKYQGKRFFLIGNKKDETQTDISLMSVGENVEIEYDENKEKFVVVDKKYQTFLGYIRENKYMTDDETYSGCLYDISIDDDGFYKVEVVVPDAQFNLLE